MFWISARNGVGNTEVFWSLLGSAYTELRPVLPLPPPHRRVGWGCPRGWEGAQPGQLTLTHQRGVPHHAASRSAVKLGWVGHLAGAAIVWGLAGHRLVVSNWFCRVFFHHLFLLVLFLFLFIVFFLFYLEKKNMKQTYLKPWVLSLLPFWFSPPSHWTAGWASGCVELSCLLGLNHNSFESRKLLKWL